MPVTFLAHQAPILPLKRWQPSLDGVAMVAGSITPDLARTVPPGYELIYDGHPIWWDGHAPAQALAGGLVVGLLLTWSARRLVLPRLAGHLPDLGSFHLRDLRLLGRTRHRWWMVILGVVIGTVTHLVLDLPTHTDRGIVVPGTQVHLIDLGSRSITVANLMQVLLSIGLSAFAVWEMWDIGRRRLLSWWSGVEPSVPPAMPHTVAVRVAVAVAAAASVMIGLTQVHRGPTVGALTTTAVGWLMLCGIAAFVPTPTSVASSDPAHSP